MKVFTQQQFEQLLKNGSRNLCAMDHFPVAFLKANDLKFLLTAIDWDVPEFVYGLCDQGDGCPQLGYLSIQDLETLNDLYIPIENDHLFQPKYRLSCFAQAATALGYLTIDETTLIKYAQYRFAF